MKRSVETIMGELQECERVVKQKKSEKHTLRKELAKHPEIISRQLDVWEVPEEIRATFKLESLSIEHIEHGDLESVGGGTTLIERETWLFELQVDGKSYSCSAACWTGQDWECEGFDNLYDADESVAEEKRWEMAMEKNADEECPTASSIITLAFYTILGEGEACIVNLQ